MDEIYETDHSMYGISLEKKDKPFNLMMDFLKKHKHKNWKYKLVLFNSLDEDQFTIIDIKYFPHPESIMANLVETLYEKSKSDHIVYIGESPKYDAYVVGMEFGEGYSIDTSYGVMDGKTGTVNFSQQKLLKWSQTVDSDDFSDYFDDYGDMKKMWEKVYLETNRVSFLINEIVNGTANSWKDKLEDRLAERS